MLEFLQSLSLFGVLALVIVVLGLFYLKKLIFLRSPLDSEQHKLWRRTGGVGRPDHLDQSKE